MKPLVSVIIPVYNVEKYLNKCVDSIINQTYSNLEIILIDDGSPDNCGKICDEYAKIDFRIKVVHKKNGGLSEARNVGLNMCKGDYIFFIDSDDYAEQNAIEVLLSYCKNQDPLIVVAETNFVNENGDVLKNGKGQYEFGNFVEFSPNQAAFEFAILDWGIWNKLFSRSIFEEVRFPVGKIHEDEAIMFQLINNCSKVIYINQHLYNYLKRKSSITSSDYNTKKMDWFEVWKNNVDYVKINFSKAYDRALFKMLVTAIYNLDNLLKENINVDQINHIVSYFRIKKKDVYKSKEIAINYKARLFLSIFSLKVYKKIFVR